MANLARLVSDLNGATLQMRDAAVAGDWAMVKRIQRHRALIVRKISTDKSFSDKVASSFSDQLDSIRLAEAFVIAKGRLEKEMIANSLERLKSSGKNKKVARRGSLEDLYGVVCSRK
ncbi:hypothetical protein [Imhoffiella purpurea]|uniref:hypothetical protein n=1 Tax=Imhoffiella purpurea TaxID=1249627 RepID=UPI0012FE23AC|nr:hypothetical protein [Imhoffiella purpurea]